MCIVFTFRRAEFSLDISFDIYISLLTSELRSLDPDHPLIEKLSQAAREFETSYFFFSEVLREVNAVIPSEVKLIYSSFPQDFEEPSA